MIKAGALQQSDQIRYGEEIAQVQEVCTLSGGHLLILFVNPVRDEDGTMVDEWACPPDTEVEVVGG